MLCVRIQSGWRRLCPLPLARPLHVLYYFYWLLQKIPSNYTRVQCTRAGIVIGQQGFVIAAVSLQVGSDERSGRQCQPHCMARGIYDAFIWAVTTSLNRMFLMWVTATSHVVCDACSPFMVVNVCHVEARLWCITWTS